MIKQLRKYFDKAAIIKTAKSLNILLLEEMPLD